MWPPLVSAPKFTAIITSHNYKQFVGDAINSVHLQGYENWECIIVDDASTDGSPEVISKILKSMKDKRFQLITSEKNLGQMGAMLLALRAARGDFVGFLDADDFWAPDYMQTHIEAHLNQTASAGMSCCDTAVVGKDRQMLSGTWMALGKPRGKQVEGLTEVVPFLFRKPKMNQNQKTTEVPRTYLFKQPERATWNFSPTSACVFRRDLLNVVAPRNPDHIAGFRISADYFFNMLCSTLTGCLIIDKACSYYRIHGDNKFSNNPFVGGAEFLVGKWLSGTNEKHHHLITQSIMENHELLSPVFGSALVPAASKFAAKLPARRFAWRMRKDF
jgi:glycosyltransferase involved in cell wall biosynthesis